MRWFEVGCVCVLMLACGSPSPGGAGGAPGTGGTGGNGDDPFGVGPTYCDSNPGVGGDACNGWIGVGLAPAPAHGSVGQLATVQPALEIHYEFSPNTALKQAVEDGVTVTHAGTGAVVPTQNSWSVFPEAFLVEYALTPQAPLAPGAYYLNVPRAVWEEFARPYSPRRPTLGVFRAAEFPQIASGDLRAEFRVGN